MKREIKFRAWNSETKRMIDLHKTTPLALSPGISGDGLYLPFRDEWPLMQYAGVKDTNGVDIYEGDIIRYPTLYETPEMTSTEYSNCPVVFAEGAFYLHDKNEKYDGENTLAYEMFCYDGNFEVIGNIFQNPDLLTHD